MPASHKGYTNKLLRIVEQTVAAHRMFEPEDPVLVGVSGGPDSVALLHVLIAIAPQFSLKCGIAHLNHGLRQRDSDNDAQFVESLARKFELPFYTRKVDVHKYRIEHGLSLEEAARRVRYAFLEEMAAKYSFEKIALGHHCNDNAELVLMNLLRGSGPTGISGIPPVRSGKIVRPLIRSKRSDIMEFLDQMGAPCILDMSNLDQRYLRNRVRYHLIPLLENAYNPKVTESFNRLASIVSSEEQWLDGIVGPIFESAVLNESQNSITLSISALTGIHIAALRRIVRKAIKTKKGNLRRIRYAHIDAVIRLMARRRSGGRLDLPDRIMIRREGDMLLVSKEKKALRCLDSASDPDAAFTFEYKINRPGTIFIPEIDARIKLSEVKVEQLPNFRQAGHWAGFFDMEKVRFPLVLRNFYPGDRFHPLGLSGTQKVKDFFINQKVPKAERNRCPILLSRGKIIWIVGHRIDESVKVTSLTGKVLKGELLPK